MTSTTPATSSIEDRIRAFLRSGRNHEGPFLSPTLVRLNTWILSVQTPEFDIALDGIEARASKGDGRDLIEDVADSLIADADETERKLLWKSLQEMLFYCVGLENLTCAEFKKRLQQYLHRHGSASFIRIFLSLYFFNFVWFETAESFRAFAWTPDSFQKNMEAVERTCQRVVASAWRTFEKMQRPLDLTAAQALERNIEEHLRGVPFMGPG
jgi:hypothetical protein